MKEAIKWVEDYEEIEPDRLVIRCKDCKHWYCYDDETFCSEHGIYNTNKDSYCSYAKRKGK